MKQMPRPASRGRDRRRTGLTVGLVLALVLGLAACYPGGPEDLGDIGVVVTVRNPAGDFSNLMTYAMEDTVVSLEDPDDDSSEPIDPQFNATILEALQEQMELAGFRRIDNPDAGANKPDVWLSVGAVESEVWVYWYNWGYWGGYPGWGWYYPPYVSATSYQQGTVIWQLHDLRTIEDPSDPEEIPLLNWVGTLNGALASNANTTHESIRSGIAQAFEQSPYISATGAGN